MPFSRKKKNTKEGKEWNLQYKVAKGIAGFLLSTQSRFTCFLGERINKLTNRSKQALLGAFCLVFGGFSIYAFVGAFDVSDSSVKSLTPDQVSIPKYYDPAGSEMTEPSISERDIIRINSFKKYIDSLKNYPSGRQVYDSILKTRPGLMDSVQVIEHLYYSQSK